MEDRNFTEKIKNTIQDGYKVDFPKYFNETINIIKNNITYFFIYSVLYVFINYVFEELFNKIDMGPVTRIILSIIFIVIIIPWNAGYYFTTYKIKKGDNYSFKDFFEGFNYLGSLFITYLIGGVLTLIGLLLLIIPGIYLLVAFSFAPLLIIFLNYDSIQALSTSRKIIHRQWLKIFIFVFPYFLINVFMESIFGKFLNHLGTLILEPVYSVFLFLVFNDVLNIINQKDMGPDDLTKHLVDNP